MELVCTNYPFNEWIITASSYCLFVVFIIRMNVLYGFAFHYRCITINGIPYRSHLRYDSERERVMQIVDFSLSS